MNKKRYKFLRTGYKSQLGNHVWKFGKWYTYEGKLDMCMAGFHCSKGIYQAFSYVQGEILAQVEVEGTSIVEDDKEVWEKMRIVRSWKWNKKDSVLFSIYVARLVLNNFESVCPNDDRPRKAIEAAERYVNSPTTKNRKAAESAAWSARLAAESAVESAAAWSAWLVAESAAWSARLVVESAAWSAWLVAESAESAAWSAARKDMYKKLDKWMLKHTKEMTMTYLIFTLQI